MFNIATKEWTCPVCGFNLKDSTAYGEHLELHEQEDNLMQNFYAQADKKTEADS